MDPTQKQAHVLPSRIRAMVDNIEKEQGDELRKRGHPFDCATRVYWTAEQLLRHWLGDEWVDKNANYKSPHAFLANRPGELGSWHFEVRLVELPELLLNMQAVENFAYFVEKLKTDNLDGALAALQSAQLLYVSSIPFEFVEPRPGRTYDLEMRIDARRVPCEIKSKVEGTTVSWTSVRDSLDFARRKQLPAGEPNVVMLRVPGAWASVDSGKQEINDGIVDVFRRSTRIAVVVVSWEEFELVEGAMRRVVRCKTFHNGRAPEPLVALRHALYAADAKHVWLTLKSIVCAEGEVGPGQWPPASLELPPGTGASWPNAHAVRPTKT